MKNIFLILCVAVAGAFTLNSCVLGGEIVGLPSGGGTGKESSVAFRVSVPANAPASRASRAMSYADEYAVQTVDVIVFRGGVYAYTAYGVITSPPSAPTETAGATMTFRTALVVDAAACDLMIVANARQIIADAYPSGIPAGTRQDAIEKKLLLGMPAGGWVHDRNAADYRPIPMWGMVRDQIVGPDYAAPASVCLTRMVAKVDVAVVGTAAAKFKLHTVRVYNYAKSGRLIPYTDGSDWRAAPSLPPYASSYYTELQSNGQNEWIERRAADPYTGVAGEIYLFEAPSGVFTGDAETTRMQNPCVVIGGIYGSDSSETWYRIDLAQRDAQGNLTMLPVLRNNRYVVRVSGISGSGLASADEAYRSVPTNVAANIEVWDEGGTVDYNDGRLTVSSRSITLPFMKSRTGRLTITSTSAYTIEWLDGVGGNSVAGPVSSSQLPSAVISNAFFDTRIVAGSKAGETYISFVTRLDNYSGSARRAVLRITAPGGSTVEVDVVQENMTAAYEGHSFKIFSALYAGHVGDETKVLMTDLGRPQRNLFDAQFRPGGKIPIDGFDYLLAYVADPYYADVIAAAVPHQDIIYLPYGTNTIPDKVSDAIVKWLDADSRHVLVIFFDESRSNAGLRARLESDGVWKNDIEAISNVGVSPALPSGYLRAPDAEGAAAPFFDGPFGNVPATTKFNRADGWAGYTSNPGRDVVPLIVGDKNNGAMSMGVNVKRGIVYAGDINIFDVNNMTADSPQERLMGNVWAWIVQRQIYGADAYGSDF